jgi:hypothetical protein
MAFIEKFLGQTVSIPEELRYDVKQGLWLKKEGAEAVLGLTEPALVLHGGINDLDWLVTEGAAVAENEDVAFHQHAIGRSHRPQPGGQTAPCYP